MRHGLSCPEQLRRLWRTVHTCSFQHYTTGKPRATVSRHLAPTTVADTSPHTSRPAMRDPALERAVIGTRNPSRFFRDPCCVCVCVPDQIVTRCRCLWELDDGVCVECLKYFPLRDEPGKTGAPCVKVPGSSRVPVTDQPQYRGTMARNGLRTRPPGVDPRAADGDGRRIPFVSIPRHTLILLARASAQYSLPRPRNGNFAHASRSDGPRNLLELQALHPAQPSALVLYCSDFTLTLLHTGRSLDHRNPTGAQRAASARSGFLIVCCSDCTPASFPYASASFTHSHTLSLDSCCRPTAGKSSSPAGLFLLYMRT
jgi:hypothetical protein